MTNNIVITMAGRGSRFIEAGYKQPKYEIQAKGRSLFEWSMLSLTNFISENSRVIFVCLRENASEEFIMQRCEHLGIKNVHILLIDNVTDGQATTAYLSKHLWSMEDPLLIYNIDTYVNQCALTPDMIHPDSEGWVPCFKAAGEHWSFVQLAKDGWAVDIAEKRRISDNATIGLYWFKQAKKYVEAYDRYFSCPENLVNGERYVAPLYRDLIHSGNRISISDIKFDHVHVLGTPAELQEFMSTPIDID